MIRITRPSIEADDLQAVQAVLESGYLVQGAHVAAFEQAAAEAAGTRYAVAVSNCTAALHLALLALGVRAGDLVVVTAYSYVATANVIELCGAQPVFVDICPDTFNMDPVALESTLARLMSGNLAERVKAILPVHTFGQMADMTAIGELAQRHGVPVVEDAACALGAAQHGKAAGSWGVMGCFSFHPRKAVTTGEGGMITTHDAHLVRLLRALRSHGQDPDASAVEFILPGYNYRMTDFQAALGVTQMNKLERILAARTQLAQTYDALLQDSPLTPPEIAAGNRPAYQSYVTLLPAGSEPLRAELIGLLKAEGVETGIGTWHMPLTGYFRSRYGYKPGDFPVADAVFARSLTLPLYEGMSLADQQTVVQKTLAGLAHLGAL